MDQAIRRQAAFSKIRLIEESGFGNFLIKEDMRTGIQ